MKKLLAVILIFISIILLGLIRLWPNENIHGTQRINTYEYLGNCWQGDVRICDYDPFD